MLSLGRPPRWTTTEPSARTASTPDHLPPASCRRRSTRMPPALVPTVPPTVAESRAARSTPYAEPGRAACWCSVRERDAGADGDLPRRSSTSSSRVSRRVREHHARRAVVGHRTADEPGVAALGEHRHAGVDADAARRPATSVGAAGPDDGEHRAGRSAGSSPRRTALVTSGSVSTCAAPTTPTRAALQRHPMPPAASPLHCDLPDQRSTWCVRIRGSWRSAHAGPSRVAHLRNLRHPAVGERLAAGLAGGAVLQRRVGEATPRARRRRRPGTAGRCGRAPASRASSPP